MATKRTSGTGSRPRSLPTKPRIATDSYSRNAMDLLSRPAARRVAASLPKHADSIIAPAYQFAGMKEYRDDVRAHAVKFGRDPDDIKVGPLRGSGRRAP